MTQLRHLPVRLSSEVQIKDCAGNPADSPLFYHFTAQNGSRQGGGKVQNCSHYKHSQGAHICKAQILF
jgi:hypothetical protein